MDAGKREHPVYFEKPQNAGTNGEKVTTWVDPDGNSPPEPDWAKVVSERGNEALESARTQSTEVVRMMVVYRADVLTTWRVKWEDQYYDIIAVDRSKKRQNELWFTARLKGAA